MPVMESNNETCLCNPVKQTVTRFGVWSGADGTLKELSTLGSIEHVLDAYIVRDCAKNILTRYY